MKIEKSQDKYRNFSKGTNASEGLEGPKGWGENTTHHAKFYQW